MDYLTIPKDSEERAELSNAVPLGSKVVPIGDDHAIVYRKRLKSQVENRNRLGSLTLEA